MKSYGQFCSMARALDLLGERWTLLIVRELLCGSRRFGGIQRGIPRISRTMPRRAFAS
jgi:DNA-binding HxlR family transcriptional regulator